MMSASVVIRNLVNLAYFICVLNAILNYVRKTVSSKKNELKSYDIKTPIFKTEIIPLDAILGGGIRKGEVIQIVAESGFGKSTIACHVASKYCVKGKKVLYIDAEGSISIELLESLGLDEEIDKNFFYIREAVFSKVEETIDLFIREDSIDLIIIDSIACLIPEGFSKVEKGISITTNNTNYTSRQLTSFFNKYNYIIKTKHINLLLINQYRNKVDMKVGTILKEYGGKNTKYNSDVILKISTIKSTGVNKKFKQLKLNNDPGTDLEFEIIKSNKMPPGITVPFYLIYGRGISNIASIMYALLQSKYVEEKNSFYRFKSSKSDDKEKKELLHGIDAFVNYLKGNYPTNELEEVVIKYYNELNLNKEK